MSCSRPPKPKLNQRASILSFVLDSASNGASCFDNNRRLPRSIDWETAHHGMHGRVSWTVQLRLLLLQPQPLGRTVQLCALAVTLCHKPLCVSSNAFFDTLHCSRKLSCNGSKAWLLLCSDTS